MKRLQQSAERIDVDKCVVCGKVTVKPKELINVGKGKMETATLG